MSIKKTFSTFSLIRNRIHTESKRTKMEDNLVDVVLYSFDKFMQNGYVYYQQNGVFEVKSKPDSFPLFQQYHLPNFPIITCFPR